MPTVPEAAADDEEELRSARLASDAFIKETLAHPERAALFFQEHLPQDIVPYVDWSTLRLEPGSFVRRDFRQRHTDLMFSVLFQGRELLLYLIFEHQSRPDPAMALRLWGYQLLKLHRHVKHHGLPLPPIISFVLNQGPEKWNVAQTLEELFQLPPELEAALLPYLPRLRYALLDLTQFDPLTQERHEQLRVVLLLMKLVREKKVEEFLDWIAAHPELASALPAELLEWCLLYVLQANQELDVASIALRLQSNPELKQQTMSLAEKLVKQGRLEGEARGEARGLWVGKLQLLQQLMGKPLIVEAEFTKLSVAELQEQFEKLEAEYRSVYKAI
jgi:predicted transposase/invertase (TIGR01784 family)